MENFDKSTILEILPSWRYENKGIAKDFSFQDFKEAFEFMTKIAVLAEKLKHHPEWGNIYNKVNIRLSTHDHGDVTSKDIELAKLIDQISNDNDTK